jgi:DNA-binding PadR family transcriptional regulator
MPYDRLVKLNTKECLWVYVLKILSEKDEHAYTMRKEIAERFGFNPGTMTAYKVLYLLTLGGYVRARQDGRRNVYTITDKGREMLDKAVKFYHTQAKVLGAFK